MASNKANSNWHEPFSSNWKKSRWVGLTLQGNCWVSVMHACQVSSVVSDSLRPYGLYPAGLLCPWDSPGENTRVGFCTLPQRNFLTEHMSPEAPALRRLLYHWATREARPNSLPSLCLLYPQAPCGVTPAAPGYFPRGHKTLAKRCSLRVPFLINQQKRDHWVLPEAPAKVSSGHTSCDWVISQSLNSAQ